MTDNDCEPGGAGGMVLDVVDVESDWEFELVELVEWVACTWPG
jgi:hypothetical protein